MKLLRRAETIRKQTAILAATAALTAGLTSTPAQAQIGFEEAHSLRSLDIMLMVTALRCRSGPHDFQADYNRFAAAHLPHLNAAGRTLRRSFAASYGEANPSRALDRMGVRIANSYGDGHPWMECAELQRMTRELAEQSDRAKLAETASYMLSASKPTPAVQVAQHVTVSEPASALPQRVPDRIGFNMRADWVAGPR